MREEELRQKELAIRIVNEKRALELEYFKMIDDRWIGSINFVRKGEIAEKNMLFVHPAELAAQEDRGPPVQMEAYEYAQLEGSQKKEVHRFIYSHYAHKQTDAHSKVQADKEYFAQITKKLKDPKQVKNMPYTQVNKLKTELMIANSNLKSQKVWLDELPTIKLKTGISDGITV